MTIPECQICQHPKIQAIHDAIDSGRYVGVIARQYRLDLLALEKHREHRRPTHGQRGVDALGDDLQTQALPETAMDALGPALPHIRRASHLVKSYAEYQSLVVEINDALCAGIQFVREELQHDEMGL